MRRVFRSVSFFFACMFAVSVPAFADTVYPRSVSTPFINDTYYFWMYCDQFQVLFATGLGETTQYGDSRINVKEDKQDLPDNDPLGTGLFSVATDGSNGAVFYSSLTWLNQPTPTDPPATLFVINVERDQLLNYLTNNFDIITGLFQAGYSVKVVVNP